MKPTAIRWFDRLTLAGIAMSVVDVVLNWSMTMAELEADPFLVQHGLALPAALLAIIIGFGLYLLCWYLVSMRASRIGRWLVVILAVLALTSTGSYAALQTPIADYWTLAIADLLFAASAVTLFLPGAADWFRPNQISPATFE